MTEYDYSPEGYNRYMATQNRIARWVDNNERFVPKDPFTLATPIAKALALPQDYSRRSNRDRDDRERDEYRSSGQKSSSRHHSANTTTSGRSRSRSELPPPRTPALSRLQTTPIYTQLPHHVSSNSLPNQPQQHSRQSSRSSGKTTPTTNATSPLGRPSATRSRTVPQFQDPYSDSGNNNNTYFQSRPPLQQGYSQPVISTLQASGLGGQYQGHTRTVIPYGPGNNLVLIAPKGTPIQYINQPPPVPVPGFQPPPNYLSSSSTQTKSQPLFKRLFSSLKLTGGSKRSNSMNSSRSGRSRHGRSRSF